MAGKYEPLRSFLQRVSQSTKEVSLSFDEIEVILRAPLPASAMSHRPWWANQKNMKTRPQTRAWVTAGFVVDAVSQQPGTARVRFKRA